VDINNPDNTLTSIRRLIDVYSVTSFRRLLDGRMLIEITSHMTSMLDVN